MNENSASGASVEAKELLKVETDRQVTSIRYSPDGKLLLGAGYDAFIHCWDCTALHVLEQSKRHLYRKLMSR